MLQQEQATHAAAAYILNNIKVSNRNIHNQLGSCEGVIILGNYKHINSLNYQD